MAKSNHDLLYLALAGGGAFAGYEFLYKPWAAAQAAVANGAVSAGGFNFPPVSSMVTGASPAIDTSLVPGQTAPIYSSNPSLAYPGIIGNCMAKKGNTWSAAQCQTRLNAYIVSYNNAAQAIANLKANTANPAASGIPAAQAELARVDAVITQQQAALAQQPADSQGYQQFATSIAALQTDRAQIAQRIASAAMAVDNSPAIAAYQGAMAAADSDFFNLTGTHLAVGMATV